MFMDPRENFFWVRHWLHGVEITCARWNRSHPTSYWGKKDATSWPKKSEKYIRVDYSSLGKMPKIRVELQKNRQFLTLFWTFVRIRSGKTSMNTRGLFDHEVRNFVFSTFGDRTLCSR